MNIQAFKVDCSTDASPKGILAALNTALSATNPVVEITKFDTVNLWVKFKHNTAFPDYRVAFTAKDQWVEAKIIEDESDVLTLPTTTTEGTYKAGTLQSYPFSILIGQNPTSGAIISKTDLQKCAFWVVVHDDAMSFFWSNPGKTEISYLFQAGRILASVNSHEAAAKGQNGWGLTGGATSSSSSSSSSLSSSSSTRRVSYYQNSFYNNTEQVDKNKKLYVCGSARWSDMEYVYIGGSSQECAPLVPFVQNNIWLPPVLFMAAGGEGTSSIRISVFGVYGPARFARYITNIMPLTVHNAIGGNPVAWLCTAQEDGRQKTQAVIIPWPQGELLF